MQQLIGVGVLLFADNTLLLGKRKGSHGSGTWALPGGHLEIGESSAICAARETAEETGIVVHDVMNIGFTRDLFEHDGKPYIILFVKATSFSGSSEVVEPKKCEELKWFSWVDTITGLSTAVAEQAIITPGAPETIIPVPREPIIH